MTRVLVFDGHRGGQRFALVRLAILNAGDGKGERSRTIVRKEARLLDALDTVSEPVPSETDKDARALNPAGGTVTLSQDDFDLLTTYLDTTPWLPRAARDAVDVQDWLSASERQD